MQRKNSELNNNIDDSKKFSKVAISWYPGHMAKTRRQIIEDLKLIDIVVEILDARIPLSSQNPDIKEIIKDKMRIVILNKCDLSCEKENKKWVENFEKQGIPAILVDSVSGKGISEVMQKIPQVYSNEKYNRQGRVGKSIRMIILGIPNVGKSSFINRLAKRNTAQVGNKPGVTRQKQWIKLSNQIELLDTPGVLWPKLDSQNIALNLAYTGTIKDDVLQTIEIGFELLKKLTREYMPNLIERYKLSEGEIKDIMDNKELQENEKVLEIMNLIGKKRGAIISGGEINQERVATILLEDFRSGKLGKITLEKG